MPADGPGSINATGGTPILRRDDHRFAAGWMLVLGALGLGPTLVWADEPRDDRIAAIVAAVRAEEASFKDIEYVARIVVSDARRKDSANPADFTSIITRRVVIQGDRFSLRSEAYERRGPRKFRHEEISAYDGKRTRSMTAGNCATIHLGRFQHPDILRMHSLALAQFGITFPLSVYLNGTDAIHAYLRSPADVSESGAANAFSKIAIQCEGEELLDGLRCLKLRVDRWFPPNTAPTQYLWLAPERNYHCVKEQFHIVKDQLPWHEMHVDELREAAPGTWFPAKITTIEYDSNYLKVGKQVVVSRSITSVAEFSLHPRHETAFFSDVAFPADLPVLTTNGRKLVGSILPEPIDDDKGRKKLAELAARVAANEKRYDDIEVKARVSWKYPDKLRHTRNDEVWDDRSLLRGNLAYFSTRRTVDQVAGWQDMGGQVHAYDGQWTRVVMAENLQQPETLAVHLRRGRASNEDGVRGGIFVYRPHTLLLRTWLIFGPLNELLASPRSERSDRAVYSFRYCGEAEVDGHPCIEIRGDYSRGRPNQTDSFVMYLATDRNDIPVKMETYQDSFGKKLIPRTITYCGDLREIAPGLWYPSRVTALDLSGGSEITPGWILLSSHCETTIESVTMAPKVSDAIFHDVMVPAGATVQVLDDDGKLVCGYPQTRSGVASLTTAEYLKLLSEASVNPREARARQKARDAVIGAKKER